MTHTFTIDDAGASIIDSRDVIARIEELSELEAAATAVEAAQEDRDAFDEALADELRTLREFAEEASLSPDWGYGEALVHEDAFEDYARELAEDCGMIASDLSWPNNCIDWDEAARQLRQDYFEVELDGETYLIRC